MELAAVLAQVQKLNEEKKLQEKKDKQKKKKKENEETELVSLIQATPSATDGRRSLSPIPEVENERDESESVAGSSQSLGYVAVPIIQPNETDVGVAAAPRAAAAAATSNDDNGRCDSGRSIVSVNTRPRHNLVTSRQRLMECLAQGGAKEREREAEKSKPAKWIRRLVVICALVVLCVLVVSVLAKLILLCHDDRRSG